MKTSTDCVHPTAGFRCATTQYEPLIVAAVIFVAVMIVGFAILAKRRMSSDSRSDGTPDAVSASQEVRRREP